MGEAITCSYESKTFCLYDCKILDLCTFLLCDSNSASSENFYCWCSLACFSFLPSLPGSTSSQGTICHKMEDVCSCQTAFVWNVKDRAVGQSFLIIPWLRNGCHTPVYWKTRYSVKVAGYFGNYVLYSPKNKNLLKLKHRRGTVLTLFDPISYIKTEISFPV